jgi:hypothetical protein
MKHAIIELHCLYPNGENNASVPDFCRYGPGNEGFHCVVGDGQKCYHLGLCEAGNELAYSRENGEVPFNAWIGFGGEMEFEGENRSRLIANWESICRKKIDEAYDLYMDKVKGNLQE